METKAIIFGAVAIVIGGGGAIVVNSFMKESLKADVRAKSADVAAVRQGLAMAENVLQRHTDKLDELQKGAGRGAAATKAAEDLTSQVAKLEKQVESAVAKWDVNVQMMQEAVEQARSAFRNEVINEIPLKNGETLKDCKFVGIKEGNCLFQHSTGTARLLPAQLPAELADRLRPDLALNLQVPPDPSAPAPSLPASVATADPGVTPVPESPPPDAEPTIPAAAPSPDAGKMAEARNTRLAMVARLRSQVATARTQRQAYLDEARIANAKFRDARLLGRSSSQSAIRDKAQAAADTLAGQIAQAEAQIAQLETELSNIR